MHSWFFSIILFAIMQPILALAAQGEHVTYEVNQKSYEGYFISPGKNAPLVLLIHDWDGLTHYEIKRANMLAEMGYAVFAADLFGAGVRPTAVTDKRQHTGELYQDRSKMRSLMIGALDAAAKKGADIDNTVAMGYCFGGAAVLELARSGIDLKGFATFHGGLTTPDGQDYTHTKGEILVMHGSADTAIPMEIFATLTNMLEDAGVKHQMITYSRAPHAFTVFDSKNYRQDADFRSWVLFSKFLQNTLK